MRAAVLHGAHDLRIDTIEPGEPGPGEVLVRVRIGGICGSDLSYFNKFRVGDFDVREPLTLGHEVAGHVAALSAGVTGLAVGMPVAINPSRPCLICKRCRAGRSNLCTDMRFLGSAARMPHVQGAFSETIVLRADQCVPIPETMPMRIAACAEPLSVALHGVRRAGEVFGRHAIVLGAGPIGALCVIALARAGAASILATDLLDEPLAIARRCGASSVVNVARDEAGVAREAGRIGGFDIAIEATGVPVALASLPAVMAPGGRIVQLGLLPPGPAGLAVNLLVTRELELVGSFRFHEEFATAVAMLASGAIDVSPILSAEFALADASEAFVVAGDRRQAIKVHLAIG